MNTRRPSSSPSPRPLSMLSILLLLGVAGPLGGCRALAVLFGEQPTKTVAAEYPYLTDQRVCILVRADMETLFEYPHVQWEVADHVRVALESNVQALSVVEPRKVVDHQRANPEWETADPARLGQEFGADRVIDINLTQYTTREPESPHLHRGYITALVSVYNTQYPNSEPAYSKEVRTVYPADSPGQWGVGDQAIRRATLEAFSQEVAGKFYDRKVKAD